MKIKTIFLLASAICSGLLSAQDTIIRKHVKEIYLSVSNVNPLNVGLRYKTQIGEKTFLKLGLVDLQYRVDKSNFIPPNREKIVNTTYSGGLLFGLEFRKQITERFTFYHGPNVGFNINYNETKRTGGFAYSTTEVKSNTNYTAQLPYTFGFLFALSKEFLLAAEINPSVYYSENANNRSNTLGVNLSSNSALLSMVYRF